MPTFVLSFSLAFKARKCVLWEMENVSLWSRIYFIVQFWHISFYDVITSHYGIKIYDIWHTVCSSSLSCEFSGLLLYKGMTAIIYSFIPVSFLKSFHPPKGFYVRVVTVFFFFSFAKTDLHEYADIQSFFFNVHFPRCKKKNHVF